MLQDCQPGWIADILVKTDDIILNLMSPIMTEVFHNFLHSQKMGVASEHVIYSFLILTSYSSIPHHMLCTV